ncbi:CDP-diacylglycerol--serine O-phosphatidyltransferase [Candidatus Binatia bacterium]|jgi:CDP-diacylglycerol--serine O-phosphatidyltransferase|nr:CDP-diacylglycerol--serine O-phosphatidyltransferase [Candidatus Binatia bacterium]
MRDVHRGRIRLLRGGADRRASLQKGVYILPNLFTTAGLFLGVYAIIKSSHGDFLTAAIAICAAHICDGLDGRIARLTNTTSQFGVEYDSLADLVAFGVAPGVLAYRWALEPWGAWGWLATSLFVACGALRLARFNVQSSHAEKRTFVGLPIPAAADMIAATVLLYYFFGGEGATNKHLVLLLLVYGLALLMVSNVRYYSFKDIDLRARMPFYAVVGMIVLVMLVVAQPQILFFLGILTYVASGPTQLVMRLARRRRIRGAGEARADDATSA